MRWIPRAAYRSIIRGIALSTFAAMPVHPVSLLPAQSPQVAPRPNLRLPDEAAGIDAIVRALVAAFDQVDVVALGEAHVRKVDSDLRIALVRHPDFAKKARSIVIECGSTSEQSTLDRYIRGENVPRTRLEQVWKTTQGTNGFCDAPMYADFLAAIRDVNSKLPPVLVSLQRLPFRNFTAEEFLGRTLTTCRPPGGCRGVFKGSTLTLAQMADVGVYVGRNPDAAVQAKPARFE